MSVAATAETTRRAYAESALATEAANVAAAQPGTRNATLYNAAFQLAAIHAGAPEALGLERIETTLTNAAAASGLGEPEIKATLNSGLAAGAKSPRDLSHVGTDQRNPTRPRALPSAVPAKADTDDKRNRDRALALWTAARPALGTVAETYLRERGITGDLPLSIRFHPAVPMPDAGQYPALVVVVIVPTTGEQLAVQRIALRADGGKATLGTRKAALGKTGGGAVVCGDLAATDGAILEGEGVETVLSARLATGLPGIATLSCSTLGKPPLPDGRAVVILVDRGATTKAREAAARRHAQGRAVRLAFVPDDFRPGVDGTDANDLLRERGPDAVRAMIDSAKPYRPEPVGPAPLPDGFRRLADGRIEFARLISKPRGRATADNDEEVEVWEPLCSPFEVLAASRTANGNRWGCLVRVQNRDAGWSECLVQMSWFAGDGMQLREHLLSLGLTLFDGQAARNALNRLIKSSQPTSRVLTVQRLGWHDLAFVMPDAVFGDSQGQRLMWEGGALDHRFKTGGTLGGWQATVGAWAVGNSRLVTGLSVAFAAPLARHLSFDGGGFHFRGDSSLGKTTMLQAAGSVWGGGPDGFIRTWRATDNGLEGVAAAHCDALLCMDELGEIDGRDAWKMAYMLANGQGKQRAGEKAEARAPFTWRTTLLSTGEISLDAKVSEAGLRTTAGQEVRMIDIRADAGAGHKMFETIHGRAGADLFANDIKAASGQHYGHAARAFLSALTAEPDRCLGLVRQALDEFKQQHGPPDAAPQVGRVLARFALVAAAGELAAMLGIVPWPTGEAARGVAACFHTWLAERGGAGDLEADRAVAMVRAFIEANGTSRFAPLNAPDTKVHNSVGFYDRDNRRWLVFPNAWKTEVCKGHDARRVARALSDRGMLDREDTQDSLQIRVRLNGERLHFYSVTTNVFETAQADLSHPSHLSRREIGEFVQ